MNNRRKIRARRIREEVRLLGGGGHDCRRRTEGPFPRPRRRAPLPFPSTFCRYPSGPGAANRRGPKYATDHHESNRPRSSSSTASPPRRPARGGDRLARPPDRRRTPDRADRHPRARQGGETPRPRGLRRPRGLCGRAAARRAGRRHRLLAGRPAAARPGHRPARPLPPHRHPGGRAEPLRAGRQRRHRRARSRRATLRRTRRRTTSPASPPIPRTTGRRWSPACRRRCGFSPPRNSAG